MEQSPATPPPSVGQLSISNTTPTTPPSKETTANAPDSLPCERKFTSSGYRTSGLDVARRMIREDIDHVVLLPPEILWNIPLAYELDGISQYLVEKGWLVDGKWNPQRISKESLDSQWDLREWDALRPLADIFNQILAYPPAMTTRKDVRCMVHAGWATPKSDKMNKHRPDAFLLMNSSLGSNPSDMSGTEIPNTIHWRDVTCPFKYVFGNGDKEDNRNKLFWNLHHELRSDPRRAFSFGVTVNGTKLCIWLACRVALFKFHSIDWFEKPDLLIQFFVLLAFASESDLGFDTEIERVGISDFHLCFPIQGTNYLTSMVLYDVGADSMCGRGTWVFEVYPQDQANARPCVIKDCWVEDQPGRQMEHVIIEGVREAVGHDKFREHFVDFCGYRKVTNEALGKYCRIPSGGKLDTGCETLPFVWEAKVDHTANYSQLGQGLVASQDSHLNTGARGATQQRRPHARFRYQIVYAERGSSLYDITSLSETFVHLIEVADGLLLLHEAGFVHRDLSPGNIIVVDGKAKISDLEFAKARKVADLQGLTKRPEGSSLPAVVDTRTGTLKFAAIEAVESLYKFTPPVRSPTQRFERRIFLYTPLHDYESVWWIAAWVVFSCTLNATKDDPTARNMLFSDRSGSFSHHCFKKYGRFLPTELHPLVDILETMRVTLLVSYYSYEENFDGSKMLEVVPSLIGCLRDLVEVAKPIKIEPLHVSSTVERSDMLIGMQEDKGSVLGGGKIKPDEGAVGDDVGTPSRKRRRVGSIDPGYSDGR